MSSCVLDLWFLEGVSVSLPWKSDCKDVYALNHGGPDINTEAKLFSTNIKAIAEDFLICKISDRLF